MGRFVDPYAPREQLIERDAQLRAVCPPYLTHQPVRPPICGALADHAGRIRHVVPMDGPRKDWGLLPNGEDPRPRQDLVEPGEAVRRPHGRAGHDGSQHRKWSDPIWSEQPDPTERIVESPETQIPEDRLSRRERRAAGGPDIQPKQLLPGRPLPQPLQQ
jgi:hypothetical protein